MVPCSNKTTSRIHARNRPVPTVGQHAPDDEGDALGGADALGGQGQEDGVVVPEAALLGLYLMDGRLVGCVLLVSPVE